jgi:hypothetical protein
VNCREECIFDCQITGCKGFCFSRLRAESDQGTGGARDIRAVFVNRAAAKSGRLRNVPGSNGVAQGNAELGPASADESAVAIVQPHSDAQVGFESHQIGVPISIDVEGENAEDRSTDAQTQWLAFSRQQQMDEGRTLLGRNGSAVGKTIAIKIRTAKAGRMLDRSGRRQGSRGAGQGGQENQRRHSNQQNRAHKALPETDPQSRNLAGTESYLISERAASTARTRQWCQYTSNRREGKASTSRPRRLQFAGNDVLQSRQ